MKLESINKIFWSEIPKSENSINGYLGTFITYNEMAKVDLLVFKDEFQKKHFVIEGGDIRRQDIYEPNINGLKLSVKQFKFNGKDIKEFIDLECSIEEYSEEFTEIVKEIATEVLVLDKDPIASVMNVIEKWKTFWGSRISEILSEEDQIGLFCELVIFKKLCDINPKMALNSWRGPLKEKHDFVFSDWVFEIKGTRSSTNLHWINGIDQLKKPENKNLAFIAFLLTMSHSSISIQSEIESIAGGPLRNKYALIESFYKLLVAAGYSRLFSEEYRKLQFEVIECTFFNVDVNFPKLTSENLKEPVSSRVSEIRYKIDLQGLSGQSINTIHLGNYFY